VVPLASNKRRIQQEVARREVRGYVSSWMDFFYNKPLARLGTFWHYFPHLFYKYKSVHGAQH
jgi:hypothetical protein